MNVRYYLRLNQRGYSQRIRTLERNKTVSLFTDKSKVPPAKA